MLIQKPRVANDVITIKTTAGDEVIAKLVNETVENLRVHKPVILVQTPQGKMALVPYLATSSDDDIDINKFNVIAVAKTAPMIVGQYLQSFSGITIPTAENTPSNLVV